jgi:hypothetical protein
MTSPDPKPNQNPEAAGGGMLPALLAGAGILAVAALFIFGGDDDATTDATQNQDGQAAHSSSARAGATPKTGVAARQADEATRNGRPQPRLNPRIANAIVTEGMAPAPNKKPEPTSWGSVDEEIIYWEDQLREANRMLEIRERASEHAPKAEAKIREKGTAEELAMFQQRLVVVADNLERAQARVDEVQLKLENLR